MVQMTGEAGTILILAKGDYDANVTYDILNLVNHNGLSWLAKKASTGIEPSDANAEYWHPFGTAVKIATKDNAGTVRPDGETITIDENGVISSVGGTAEKVTYENESVADVTNVKEALDNIYSDYAEKSDLANYLPLSGGTLTGDIVFEPMYAQGCNAEIGKWANATVDNGTIIRDKAKSGKAAMVRIKADKGLNGFQYEADETISTILHTGNKPIGTYTGNGSATGRTIETGGIGRAILLTSNGGSAWVNNYGAVFLNGVSGEVKGLKSNELRWENGSLYSATTLLNSAGESVNYQVL